MADYFDYDFLVEHFPQIISAEEFNIATVICHVEAFCEDSIHDKVFFSVLLDERIRKIQHIHRFREKQRKWESIDV